MKKTLVMAIGLYAAMLAGAVPSFAISYPVWSGAPVMAPGDAGIGPHQTPSTHVDKDGTRTSSR